LAGSNQAGSGKVRGPGGIMTEVEAVIRFVREKMPGVRLDMNNKISGWQIPGIINLYWDFLMEQEIDFPIGNELPLIWIKAELRRQHNGRSKKTK
jgi:hypothetical protein